MCVFISDCVCYSLGNMISYLGRSYIIVFVFQILKHRLALCHVCHSNRTEKYQNNTTYIKMAPIKFRTYQPSDYHTVVKSFQQNQTKLTNDMHRLLYNGRVPHFIIVELLIFLSGFILTESVAKSAISVFLFCIFCIFIQRRLVATYTW